MFRAKEFFFWFSGVKVLGLFNFSSGSNMASAPPIHITVWLRFIPLLRPHCSHDVVYRLEHSGRCCVRCSFLYSLTLSFSSRSLTAMKRKKRGRKIHTCNAIRTGPQRWHQEEKMGMASTPSLHETLNFDFIPMEPPVSGAERRKKYRGKQTFVR